MANKYFLFIKPKFLLTILLSFMFAILPIRQYRKFVNEFDTNSQGLGLVFADWFFRFQLVVILLIPFLLTLHWLNKEDQIQSFERNYSFNRSKTKFNMSISFVIYSLLGCWLYTFGTEST